MHRLILIWTFVAACLGTSVAAQIPGPLAGRVFGSGPAALVVVLHGDLSRGGPADYHQPVAERLAALVRGVTAVALIRPGYADSRGLQSPGSNNNRRDHYTAANNDLVAQTIRELRRSTGARRVIAVGHSGGAAQIGAVIGRHPGLIDVAILVSCPCNIGQWRRTSGGNRWPASQSPHEFLAGVAADTRIVAITGARDDNTRPRLAQDYVAAARARGLQAEFVAVPGAGHGFDRLAATVEQAVRAALR